MQAVFQPQIFVSDPSCFRFRVALALVRAGHDVHGSTLELNRVKELEAEESESVSSSNLASRFRRRLLRLLSVTPVICDLLAPSEYRHVLAGMDVVIDAAGGADIEELGPTILANYA